MHCLHLNLKRLHFVPVPSSFLHPDPAHLKLPQPRDLILKVLFVPLLKLILHLEYSAFHLLIRRHLLKVQLRLDL
jgi:hypothetical protein